MLENIKSSFLTNILFSYLNEEIKLKIIKYNKNFQNLLGINLFIIKYLMKELLYMKKMEKQKNITMLVVMIH